MTGSVRRGDRAGDVRAPGRGSAKAPPDGAWPRRMPTRSRDRCGRYRIRHAMNFLGIGSPGAVPTIRNVLTELVFSPPDTASARRRPRPCRRPARPVVRRRARRRLADAGTDLDADHAALVETVAVQDVRRARLAVGDHDVDLETTDCQALGADEDVLKILLARRGSG